MIRAIAAALALLPFGVSPAAADPSAADYQYCAHVAAELQNHDTTKGTTLTDCAFIAEVGKSECRYFIANGMDMNGVVDYTQTKYKWDHTMAAIILVYAVNDYCPEMKDSLPKADGSTPAPTRRGLV